MRCTFSRTGSHAFSNAHPRSASTGIMYGARRGLLFRGGGTSPNTFENVLHSLNPRTSSCLFAVFGLRLTRYLFLGNIVSSSLTRHK